MKYGIILTTGTIHEMIEMAAAADAAGWDGVFYWDGVAIGDVAIYDPWVVLAALAMRTEKVRLGNIVTPPSRRRPWKLARETMSVDQLSGGRLVLPVGLGALDDVAFGGVGEPTDLRTRAALLDESLEFLTRAWSGQPFSYEGKHFKTAEMTFQPPSAQQPRIPIWVIAAWPREKSVARALRYDGIIPQQAGEAAPASVTPDDVRAMAALGRERRLADIAPWEIIIGDTTPDNDPAVARAKTQSYADAGATWWIESPWTDATVASLRAKIAAGPPK